MKIFVRINDKETLQFARKNEQALFQVDTIVPVLSLLTLRIKVIYSKLPLLARDDTQLRDSIKEVCVAALWCLIFQLISQ